MRAQLEAAPRIGSSGRSATRRAVTSSAVAPPASSASHSRDWRATSALRWNSSRSASSSPSVSPGNASAEPLAAPDGGVDLVARVVVLEDDGDLADLRQPAHGVARVGGHEEGEVGRALRRRQPQPDVDVAAGRHVARGDEPQRRDRLVELGVIDRAERVEDVRAVCHAAPSTSCASSWAAGVPPLASWSSAGHLDVVQLGRVEAEDLLLGLRRERRVVRERLVGVVPVDEPLDLPLGLPDGVVGAEQHLVLADPEQQLAHHLREEARAGVHEAADDDREAGVDVALLRRHEAEVLDPRQAHVLDDEVELLVAGGHLVDVGDVEGVLVQRPDRRALVDVDVLDAELDALLEEGRHERLVELVAARAGVPLGGVELDALEAVLLARPPRAGAGPGRRHAGRSAR